MSVSSTESLGLLDQVLIGRPAGRNIIDFAVEEVQRLRLLVHEPKRALSEELTFQFLRQCNAGRSRIFKNRHGTNAGSELWSAAQWLQALVGEIGEYANFRKKFERGDIDGTEFLHEARRELADVMIYLDLLAAHLGIDLANAVRDKFNEVSHKQNVEIYL